MINFPALLCEREKIYQIRIPAKGGISEEEKSQRPWQIRLINIGRGPAFVQHFVTEGLTRCVNCEKPPCDPDCEKPWFKYVDGIHTNQIDKVIGPEIGDPDLQVHFAYGDPAFLRSDQDQNGTERSVSIGIVYNDIAGREFKSGIIVGKIAWDPPPEFSHSKLSLRLLELLRCISGNERTSTTVSLWLRKLQLKFYKDLEEPNDEVRALRDFLDKYLKNITATPATGTERSS